MLLSYDSRGVERPTDVRSDGGSEMYGPRVVHVHRSSDRRRGDARFRGPDWTAGPVFLVESEWWIKGKEVFY